MERFFKTTDVPGCSFSLGFCSVSSSGAELDFSFSSVMSHAHTHTQEKKFCRQNMNEYQSLIRSCQVTFVALFCVKVCLFAEKDEDTDSNEKREFNGACRFPSRASRTAGEFSKED